jgi:hypothetical protein
LAHVSSWEALKVFIGQFLHLIYAELNLQFQGKPLYLNICADPFWLINIEVFHMLSGRSKPLMIQYK